MQQSDYPAIHAAADAASIAGQRAYVRLTRAELALMLGAAAMTALRLAIDPQGALSATAVTVALVLALVLRMVNRSRRYDKTWFDGRAVAESAKSASWRFAMRMEPYDGSDTEATSRLLNALRELLHERQELAAQLHVNPTSMTIGPALMEMRRLPISERLRVYIEERVQEQFEWYDARSRMNRASAARWYWSGLGAQLMAIIIAVGSVSIPVFFAAIGLLSSVAAATTASAQLGRHDELGRSYALAAAELSLIRGSLESVDSKSADEVDERLRDAEGAISREHTMWIAKRA